MLSFAIKIRHLSYWWKLQGHYVWGLCCLVWYVWFRKEVHFHYVAQALPFCWKLIELFSQSKTVDVCTFVSGFCTSLRHVLYVSVMRSWMNHKLIGKIFWGNCSFSLDFPLFVILFSFSISLLVSFLSLFFSFSQLNVCYQHLILCGLYF